MLFLFWIFRKIIDEKIIGTNIVIKDNLRYN